LVARSTLCEAAPPVERHSTRMNGSGAWPWSAGFRAAAHGSQHTEVIRRVLGSGPASAWQR
jgi:hypothetical protein